MFVSLVRYVELAGRKNAANHERQSLALKLLQLAIQHCAIRSIMNYLTSKWQCVAQPLFSNDMDGVKKSDGILYEMKQIQMK